MSTNRVAPFPPLELTIPLD